MTSENIKDHEVLDILDLSESEVEEWIPDTDEEWDVDNEKDNPEPNHQERSNVPWNNSHVPDPDVRRLADIGPTVPGPNFEPMTEADLHLPDLHTRQDLKK
ncbi:hypothetical protein PoB_000689500 [Plakobranchus ocellatus]|uniref:Uncharacterized protein n=1 Tax=Plakobranchus ocellatus TaxID=259542 RepID=A0AAV3YBG8_9GAST|nr:hypothetical protein PoB_000689500 [Plakobranchus ocellatus]